MAVGRGGSPCDIRGKWELTDGSYHGLLIMGDNGNFEWTHHLPHPYPSVTFSGTYEVNNVEVTFDPTSLDKPAFVMIWDPLNSNCDEASIGYKDNVANEDFRMSRQ